MGMKKTSLLLSSLLVGLRLAAAAAPIDETAFTQAKDCSAGKCWEDRSNAAVAPLAVKAEPQSGRNPDGSYTLCPLPKVQRHGPPKREPNVPCRTFTKDEMEKGAQRTLVAGTLMGAGAGAFMGMVLAGAAVTGTALIAPALIGAAIGALAMYGAVKLVRWANS